MRKALKILGYVLVTAAVAVAAGVLYLQYAFPNVDAAPTISVDRSSEQVERGRYLANHVTVCIDCHSTRDWSRFSGPITPHTEGMGGDVFDKNAGFPGTFYAKNITPDNETGIGTWTDGEVYRAITRGVSKNGDPLFPVMPYKAYSHLTTQDAHAIVAYLRTLQPIRHQVPNSKPDFPMNLIMRTMPTDKVPALAEAGVLDTPVSRGKYLVTIAACGDCHTPQQKGTPVEGKYLAGGFEFKFPNGTLRSSNLTPDKETGLGNWTEDTFVNRFKQAAATPKVSQGGFNTIMPWSMYAGMAEEDLRAIYAYLMSLEPNKNKVERFTPAAS